MDKKNTINIFILKGNKWFCLGSQWFMMEMPSFPGTKYMKARGTMKIMK